MIRRRILIKFIGVCIALFCFANNPCDARRVSRERGGRYRTRSLLPDGKSGGKAGGKLGKKGKDSDMSIGLEEVSIEDFRQEDQSRYWTRRSCKEKHSGGGKASSCSPSSHPTTSSGLASSLISSSTPTPTASKSPSDSPTADPTAATSKEPTADPTATPSKEPTVDPTVTPSKDPTASPTTWYPTTFIPTGGVTTEAPSEIWSYAPTGGASEGPTVFWSGSPTTFVPAFSTVSVGNNTGLESHCNNPKPSVADGGNFHEDQILVFQYLLLVNESILENDPVVTEMEKRIHEGLVDHFLACRFGNNRNYSFYVWSIFSKPPDFVASDPCEANLLTSTIPNPPSESRCMVVQAELKMHVYFPSNRRLEPMSTTTADPEVVVASVAYLNTSMSRGDFDDGAMVLDTHFLFFVSEGNAHSTIDRGAGPTVAEANTQVQGEEDDSRVVAGAMTMAAAAACLIAIVILSVRRRRERSDAYRNRIDDLTTYSDFNNGAFERAAYIVGDRDDNSLDWFQEEPHGDPTRDLQLLTTIPLDYQQDVHVCASAYCNCHRLETIRPTFIASNSLNVPDILEDLRRDYPVLEERSYSSPDTVDL